MPFQLKKGLNYFYFDVRFLEDPRVRSLLLHYKDRAIGIYVTFLCIVYRDGYFIKTDLDTLIDDISFELGTNSSEDNELIRNVIETMVQKGLIDKSLYEDEGVFTSKAIQRHFYSCTLRRKKQPHPYWLLTAEEEDDITRYSKGKDEKSNG